MTRFRPIKTPVRAIALLLLLVALSLLPGPVFGQRASTLSQVRAIRVQDFNGGEGAALLHDAMVQRLSKGRFQIVASTGAADALLKGTGHVWVRARASTNACTPQRDPRAVYGGYLSLELVGTRGEPLWSWLVTPGKMTWNNIIDDLAGHAAKKLVEDVESAPQPSPSSAPAIARAGATLTGAEATFGPLPSAGEPRFNGPLEQEPNTMRVSPPWSGTPPTPSAMSNSPTPSRISLPLPPFETGPANSSTPISKTSRKRPSRTAAPVLNSPA